MALSGDRPFVLLLTHKRGGGVLACRPQHLLTHQIFCGAEMDKAGPARRLLSAIEENLLQVDPSVQAQFERLFVYLFYQKAWQPSGLSESFWTTGGAGVGLCLSKSTTAEHLAEMFLQSLYIAGISEDELYDVVVGQGPGSFTGLRIGSAFASGLTFRQSAGGARQRWFVPSWPILSVVAALQQAQVDDYCAEELDEVRNAPDESQVAVGFLDLLLAVACLATEHCCRVDSFLPRYGKEPGPVLKLKEVIGGQQN